jgi:hypothetical protein
MGEQDLSAGGETVAVELTKSEALVLVDHRWDAAMFPWTLTIEDSAEWHALSLTLLWLESHLAEVLAPDYAEFFERAKHVWLSAMVKWNVDDPPESEPPEGEPAEERHAGRNGPLSEEVQCSIMHGVSLEPTLHNGEIVQVDASAYRRHAPARGDVVLLWVPGVPSPTRRFPGARRG